MPKAKFKRKRAPKPPQKVLSYFAADGSYGNAEGYVLMETTYWNEVDWDIIEDTSEMFRPIVSRLITESYELDADEEGLRAAFERYGVDLSKYGNF